MTPRMRQESQKPALFERERTGRGQVLDVASLDGVTVLLQPILELLSQGDWVEEREANLLDGGTPFYRTYRCKDGRFVAVGALEPQFYAALLETLGLADHHLPRMTKPVATPRRSNSRGFRATD
jgi:alpha-methylacyl-CoA racemase